MAPDLYARYVPPPKKKPTLIEKVTPTISSPNPPVNSNAKSTTKDASFTYARYVPPSKSKKDSVSRNATENLPSAAIVPKRKHEEFNEEPTYKSDAKKQKKDKDVKDLRATTEIRNDSKESNDKEGKAKRKSRNKSVDVEEDVSEEEEDTRHKRLLGKRDKSVRKAQRVAAKAEEEAPLEDVAEEPPELHDLVPLPQPEPLPELPPQPLSTALPPWLANPIRVAPTATASFKDLGVSPEVEAGLQKQGFKVAFAVQAALLPYLLPGEAQQDGDFLVSAATGSGKTLSYVLPMIQDISGNRVTKLRGLIVLPTRELVGQAKEVSENCASMFTSTRRIRIGTAVGNETFKAEQASLMEQELVYDPAGYKNQLERLNSKWEQSQEGNEEDLCDDEVVADLPDHILNPISRVDILICTPGRLVEHLKSTNGFTLRDVEWLVVDEADKLLDQSFQDWLDVVTATLTRPRKVILSATMTRDVGKLTDLKLRRPQLIVVEENNEVQSQHLFLPATLKENAIKVEEEGIKPLYLMALLRKEGLLTSRDKQSDNLDNELSDSSSSTSSEDTSDDSSDTDSSLSEDANETSPKDKPHGALIFTKSNESAVRLGRLIALLMPALADKIGILTSTTKSSERRAALKSFETGKLSILFASDLVSRGLDLPDLAHVINYDIPTSLTSYVHRVGRTARAGKQGHAWTLFTSTEGRWFWNDIGKAEELNRPSKIARIKLDTDEFDRNAYEEALEALGKESNDT